MRRITAVLLGTAALLGALTTPATAASGAGNTSATVQALLATAQNTITGAQVTVRDMTGGL
ncbi:hypothetical protein [Streptomyces sp. WM6378]|uniref:hypothetical protein n=1 Tax=Streptomyces sp. WM6378 TaxID=1415557 RepID=UPI0006AE981B|nr:hypothetical protein [Streptomyces sp. WM6378]KOU39600.1 hypothetical protein ADK54_25170 [Streptomyces sp. WM6378]